MASSEILRSFTVLMCLRPASNLQIVLAFVSRVELFYKLLLNSVWFLCVLSNANLNEHTISTLGCLRTLPFAVLIGLLVHFQAIRTLAKSPRFARDPRHLQFDADVNRLFLYTRYMNIWRKLPVPVHLFFFCRWLTCLRYLAFFLIVSKRELRSTVGTYFTL
jgi:hypothetical protein